MEHFGTAILSGKRDPNHRAGQGYDPACNGGIIRATYDTFDNNYVDIMFEDWNVGGICICPYRVYDPINGDSVLVGQFFQSVAHYNYFGQLAGAGHCTNWQYVEGRIDYCRGLPPANPQNPIPNIQERCHILDFSAYQGLSATIPIGGYFWNWCPRAYQLTSDPTNNSNFQPDINGKYDPHAYNVTYDNIYYEDTHPPCGCRCNPPHDNFH